MNGEASTRFDALEALREAASDRRTRFFRLPVERQG